MHLYICHPWSGNVGSFQHYRTVRIKQLQNIVNAEYVDMYNALVV
jgi:hypothetical protein